jgi:hypothetical protein
MSLRRSRSPLMVITVVCLIIGVASACSGSGSPRKSAQTSPIAGEQLLNDLAGEGPAVFDHMFVGAVPGTNVNGQWELPGCGQ